jgi:hypothetical protein
MTAAALDDVLEEHEVAERYGVDVHTVRRWRYAKKGPGGWFKVGRKIFYPVRFIETHEAALRAEAAAKPL